MDSSFFLGIFTTVAAAIIGFFILLRKFRNHQENEDVGSSSPSSSSPPSSPSSSSSLSCKWTHHVFPSFRGEDVRRNFLSHIQKEFRRKGIIPFIDNEIRRGESIGPELIKAIKRSKIAIILISRNYASSKWCLDELVEIMNCKRDLGQTVFVIFYEVDPSHVKKLTGEFGAVFETTCKGKTKKDIARWRQAFADVATIAGYDSRNWENDADMIEEIVNEISKRLIGSTPSNDLQGLIGMGAHMEKMKELLCLGSDERRTIGIWGMSGIGKTTIARVVYNQISDGFQLSVFMTFKPSYARPICSDDHDVKLQYEQELLSQLMNQKDIEVRHLGTAQNLLMDKKVLIVLDGVDQSVQLLAMPKARCLGPGTRVIVTTQDQKLLNAFEIKHIYKVDFPPPDEALQIFCMNAFGQDSPYDGFEKLATEVTKLAGYLPLGLRVMGSYFRGMSKQDWKAELPRLRIGLDGEIESILKFSYDALPEEVKYLFLLIACCFNVLYSDEDISDNVGHKFSDVQQEIKILRQRSLISNNIFYPMHNLLVQLGREIVRKQSTDEPGKRQFLVDATDICEVLTDNTGSKSVIGINFDFSRMIEDELNISERAFEEMSNLQLLRFSGGGVFQMTHKRLYLPQGLNNLPPKLRILSWDHFPMTCFPCNFNTKFLVKIIMIYSKLEILWEGIQPLRNLVQLNLSYSTNLKELPELSTATSLIQLKLEGCSNLVELPSSIGNLIHLCELNFSGCSKLVEIPSSIGNLIHLCELNFSGCSKLVEIPSSIGNLIHLCELNFSGCSKLVEIPSSIGNLIHLGELNFSGCSKLVEIPSSIGNLIHHLGELNFSGCSKLVEIPSSIGNLIHLCELNFSGCSKLVEIPSSIGNLIHHLGELNFSGCSKLVEIPSSIGNLIHLWELNFSGCSKLVEIPSSIGNLIHLWELNFSGCSKLVEIPSSIGNLIHHLCVLNFSGCSKLVEIPSSIGNLIHHLCVLNFSGCSNLVEIPSSIGNLIHLRELDLSGWSSLVELPSSIGNLIHLNELNLSGCSSLVELPSSIGNLIHLNELNLSECMKLVSLPQLPSSLSWLEADNCESLERLGCSFPHPEICLKFTNCWKLNEKSRDIVFRTRTNRYMILPRREVPAFFTYRAATGGCVRVELNQRCFHTSLRFKACMLLVNKDDTVADFPDSLELSIRDKQSGRNAVGYPKILIERPVLGEHMYIVEAEANNVESRELFFEFKLIFSEIGECGIRPLLEEDPHVDGFEML
ncbi:Disease resistance protein TAO1 [Cardamine amara subsp. amara]|uniref:ADP-ribosyl cyclase/cyclic ADP-ribose hydrolase n=1 Tax=Cardamine amara subsp. amara TaxID=228776 RepID=A0ABD1ABP3_CARAN